ncbi:MAG: hypothetical protein IJH41_01955 [Eubacterium sp.]|nr:hypothetical protein [Eubacterium sp.]
MDLMIYSDDALEMIKLGQMTQKETLDYYKEHSKDDVAQIKAIIGAYAAELIAAADEADVKLDLTYDTIRNIPDALTALYDRQHKDGMPDPRNKEATCRSLAAYMNLLIINNFDECGIDARRYPAKDNTAAPDRWTGFLTLVLDRQKNSDMLPFVWEGANNSEEEVARGFKIDIKPLVDGYKKLTGGKLTDEGLTDMTPQYEVEGPHLIL